MNDWRKLPSSKKRVGPENEMQGPANYQRIVSGPAAQPKEVYHTGEFSRLSIWTEESFDGRRFIAAVCSLA